MRKRTYSKNTIEAIKLLGRQIKLGRKRLHWSEMELSQRAGIARRTLQKIESGDPTNAIGLVFEVATLVEIRLFESDMEGIIRHRANADAQLTLLPKHIYPVRKDIDDDF